MFATDFDGREHQLWTSVKHNVIPLKISNLLTNRPALPKKMYSNTFNFVHKKCVGVGFLSYISIYKVLILPLNLQPKVFTLFYSRSQFAGPGLATHLL